MDMKLLYRQVIMDHYKNPFHKGLVDDKDYTTIHLHNPSCGDDVVVQVKIENDIITDVKHQGTGCSICCASSSVMSISLMNKSKIQAQNFIDEFSKLVMGLPVDEKIINNDAIVFQSVHQFPARIKCATLAWKAIEEGINKK